MSVKPYAFFFSLVLTTAFVLATSPSHARAEVGINVGGSTAAGGSIKGVVKFAGKKHKQRRIKVNADPFCSKMHAKSPALSEKYVFGDNNTLQNVFVWVSKGLPKGNYPPLHAKPVINQLGCTYHPHVIGVTVGQKLTILNSDETLHNVKVKPRRNKAFNEGMPVKGMTLTKTFSKKEMGIHVKCDVHAWMSAYVNVLDHPFFAVTQKDGSFEIRGLPAGEYELRTWHEFKRFAPDQKTYKVTVTAGKASEVTITYAPKKRKK